MSKRKFIVKNHRKRQILLSILFVVLLFIGIGYSSLNTKLNIVGSLGVAKAKCQTENKLYNVLKCAAEEWGFAKKYTGEHKDSFTEEASKDIYHWYAPTTNAGNALATQILDKNNVIFADHCWQMIRTTDTGGVKMIYNGEVEDGKCLNTRGEHVGFGGRSLVVLNNYYWYGSDYIYDSSTNKFQISGTTERVIWSAANASRIIGKFTCLNADEDSTCSTLYLVDSYYNETRAYAIKFATNITYSQIGFNLNYNYNSNSPTYVGYMYGDVYSYNTIGSTFSQEFSATQTMLQLTYLSTSYWYADSITWDSSTNRYQLVNPYQVSSQLNLLSSGH